MICEHCDCDGSVRCCLCGQEKPVEDEHYGWTVGGVWMHCQQEVHFCHWPDEEP